MNAEWKQKWVDALRSGEYEQAEGKLRRISGYCCLGVLCDLVKGELGLEWKQWDGENYFELGAGGANAGLPKSVTDLVGLPDDVGLVKLPRPIKITNRVEGNLAYLNDAGADFNFIADVIEEQF